MKRALISLLLATLALFPALAERPVDITRPVSATAEISFSSLTGSVEFTGWERPEVQIKGTIGEGVEDVKVIESGGDLNIQVKVENSRHTRDADAHLKIAVPRGAQLRVESVASDVRVKDVSGRVEVEAVSGDVTLLGKPQEAEVQAVSGSVKIAAGAELSKIRIETVSGDIDFEGALTKDARARAHSVSGDIRWAVPAATNARFEVSTFSGDIQNNFGVQAERTDNHIPSKKLEFTLGKDGATVRIESFSGTVRIEKTN